MDFHQAKDVAEHAVAVLIECWSTACGRLEGGSKAMNQDPAKLLLGRATAAGVPLSLG